jgi:DNA repair exonuclease SbcCD nuclease subunit
MSSLKGLVIGDNHFSVKDLVDVDAFLVQVETAARRLEPDFIVLLGDLLHQHEMAHMDAHVRAVKLLKSLSKYALTFLLIGNHDRRNNSDFQSENHFFTGIQLPDLVIVDHALKYTVTGRKTGVVGNFLFVPYVPPGKLYDALDTIDLSEAGEDTWRSPDIDAIFCHQEFKGVQMGPIKSEAGDEWDVSWPLVISGHIHEYQLLQPNLLYPGTPLQHTFSEKPDKAITLCDFNTQIDDNTTVVIQEVRKLDDLKPDPIVRVKYLRIQLNLRLKRTVTLQASQLGSFKPDIREQTKLVLRGTASELKALTKSKTLDKYTLLGIKVSLQPVEEKVIRPGPIKIAGLEDPSTGRPKPFLQLFRELIAQDKELLVTFDQLFLTK